MDRLARPVYSPGNGRPGLLSPRLWEEALCAPGHGQLLCAENDKALDQLQRHISHLPAPGQAVEHAIERDFRLQARQGSAQAEMDTTPEGNVTIGLALNVEASGIGELGLVAI